MRNSTNRCLFYAKTTKCTHIKGAQIVCIEFRNFRPEKTGTSVPFSMIFLGEFLWTLVTDQHKLLKHHAFLISQSQRIKAWSSGVGLVVCTWGLCMDNLFPACSLVFFFFYCTNILITLWSPEDWIRALRVDALENLPLQVSSKYVSSNEASPSC